MVFSKKTVLNTTPAFAANSVTLDREEKRQQAQRGQTSRGSEGRIGIHPCRVVAVIVLLINFN